MSEQLKEATPINQPIDHAAVPPNTPVSLYELLDLIKLEFPGLTAPIVHCQHYIEIHGACASIHLINNYGGMRCLTKNIKVDHPVESIDCEVIVSAHRNNDASSSIDHEFRFKNEKPSKASISENYAESIIDYLRNNLCYLQADKSLFKRIDYKWYDDLSGANKRQTTSYDTISVSDDDFYIEAEPKQGYLNSEIDLPVVREKQIIATEYGNIVVEKLNPDENPGADFYNDAPMFIAKLENGDRYSHVRGATAQEAVDRYIANHMTDDIAPNQ